MRKLLFLLLFISGIVYSQQEDSLFLTGSLNLDSHLASVNTKQVLQDDNNSFNTRSPLLAAGLSVVLPGAGQFYNEDYWLTALFLAIEAAGITTAVVYNGKGDDQTEYFESIANKDWSPDDYADWSQGYAEEVLNITEQFYLYDENDNLIWSEVHNLESAISSTSGGTWYSHHLAPYGDQQYYEMIGKYKQFNSGWADFNFAPDEFDFNSPLTKMFTDYSAERTKANDYYSVAKTAVTIVIVNHIISALEAAWSAHRYNKSVEANVSLKTDQIGFSKIVYPQLNLKVRL